MPRPDPASPPRRQRLSRLALRSAAFTATVAAAASLIAFALIPMWPAGAAVLVGIAVGSGTYAAIRTLIMRRLTLAQATLRDARKGHFESLPQLQVDRHGDELDELMWQVYRAGRVMQQEIERLEDLENYRRDFLGNISHELKTPIFVISGFAEQLLSGALEDPRVNRRFVEKIGRNAQRLDQLSRDVLAISKIESGEMMMQPISFSMKTLVGEVIDALEPVAETKGVRLVDAVPPDLPPTLGDREQLQHVLANLVDNGIKYNNEGGAVEISASAIQGSRGAEIRVTVADTGIGIPEEVIPRITERFFRVDRSRSRQGGGTGLGLAIVKHILEAHQQRLRIESKPGQGSAFSFALPAGPSPSR